MLLGNYSHSSSTLPSKNNRTYCKNKQKNKYACIPEIIRLIIMKMKMKMKNRSYRCDLNRPNPRHKKKNIVNIKCLSMATLTCIKQHLSNIWGSIHEKLIPVDTRENNTETGLKKTRCLKKPLVFRQSSPHSLINRHFGIQVMLKCYRYFRYIEMDILNKYIVAL